MLGPGRINFHRSHYRMFLCLETPKPTPLSASSNTSALLRALREALAALTAPTDLGGIGIATRRSYKAQIVASTVHPESAFFLLLIFCLEGNVILRGAMFRGAARCSQVCFQKRRYESIWPESLGSAWFYDVLNGGVAARVQQECPTPTRVSYK